MSNLVGTGLNQVPTNGMLGGLAYQDPDHASIKDLDLKNLSQINSEIADTATNVFVYDTRKDSDGGAWRKRTQNTSWYNEPLGTAIRGTRKEFPAVAVIVCGTDGSNGYVHIYDGDDPDLPMWMMFSGGNTAFLYTTPTSVVAMNGMIFVGTPTYGLPRYDFIGDTIGRYRAGSYQGYKLNRSIENRDVAVAGTLNLPPFSTAPLANDNVNDLAITVLPNAPVDSVTGLPVPTIAVATESVTSVIKDDGTVVDYGNFSPIKKIEIDSKYVYVYARSEPNDYIFKTTFLSTDADYNVNITAGSGGFYVNSISAPVSPLTKNMVATGTAITKDHTYIRSGSDGIEIFDGNVITVDADTAVIPIAYITSEYNTGYMPGDIKGAFLSDTDTTNVVGGGDGLITGNDSTFGAVITSLNWSERSGSGGGWNVSGGVLKTGTVSSGEYLDITTSGYTSGQTYVISYTLANVTGSNPLRIRFNNGQMDNLPTSNGSHSHYITLTETGTLFSILNDSSLTADIDNFKLQLVQDEDRSVNNKGLSVYGTVTKSAVATGADLVAYSGFSLSNYLKQPHNSDMQTGTGGFSVSAWFKTTSTFAGYEGLMYYNRNESIGTGFQIMMNNSAASKGLYFYIYGSTTTVTTPATSIVGLNDGSWHQVVATHTNGAQQIFIDGVLKGSTSTVTGSINDSEAELHIGKHSTDASSQRQWRGSIALVRHSASIPSAEQIKKMYEDEKCLFHENAKATLYGSSDAVTALAYDDTTELLHVGTSAGRSDFQGLRRINNTTTAVTTAISASNDLVAEQ